MERTKNADIVSGIVPHLILDTPKVVIFAGMTKGYKENFCKGSEKFIKVFVFQTLLKSKGWIFFSSRNI